MYSLIGTILLGIIIIVDAKKIQHVSDEIYVIATYGNLILNAIESKRKEK